MKTPKPLREYGKSNVTKVAHPTADQLSARVKSGRISQDMATSESDRIQADLLRKSIKAGR